MQEKVVKKCGNDRKIKTLSFFLGLEVPEGIGWEKSTVLKDKMEMQN